MRYDVAVVGLGGMGSAILSHCARRGVRAIGLEQFARGQIMGSSVGQTRLIRKAYFEDPAYVPLLHRSYELWRQLERDTNEDLLRITGLLSVGEEGSEIIEGTRRAAREHGLALDFLERSDVAKRYPTLKLLPSEVALMEPEGGVVNPEGAIAAHQSLAEARGAEMRFEAGMRSWEATADGFEILLSDETRITADRLVIALGAWFKQTLESLGVAIRVQRNVQAWFTGATQDYDASRFPCFLLDRRGLPAALYGCPDFGHGIKVAFHGYGDLTDAQHFDRNVDMPRDVTPVARELEQWMPGAAATFRTATPCMYTVTPDHHFVVDHHPEHPRVVLCGGFSGHGFKFAPVIGEICADLALNGGTAHDIEFLSFRRFSR